MSGGSYNYLARTLDVEGAEGILTRQDDLLRMAHALEDLCPEAAEETRLFLRGGPIGGQSRSLVHLVESHAERLSPLWHAVEWHHSNDWGRDKVDKVIAEYLARGPYTPASAGLDGSWHRVGPASELVYFDRSLPQGNPPAVYPLDDVAVDTLTLYSDRLSLRFLKVRLEEALRKVDAAIELRGQAERLDASMWRVVPADGGERD